MPRIVVMGGGVCGLAAGMLLARDGHEVTLLERDAGAVPESPDEAWESWERKGVAQFRQAHFLQARTRHVLDAVLPDVRDALEREGAARIDPMRRLPPGIADREPREGDDRWVSLTARRTTLEYVFARAAAETPGLEIRRGDGVERLETGAANGGVHVTGVRTEAGQTVPADLVIDAMGRRSLLPRWLRDEGVDVHEESEDSGFAYYSRFFRADAGGVPAARMGALLSPMGSFSLLTLPSDRDTWCVTIYISARDQPLKTLRFEDRWNAVIRACPLHEHWLDGEPLTDILSMAGVVDRYRRLNADGGRRVTGLALVGDAWACTNPSLGRGIALGLSHVARLRGVVREHVDDPAAFAEAWDTVTEEELTPWYRATVAVDRARVAEIEAIVAGAPPAKPPEGPAAAGTKLPLAARFDPEAFRAMLDIIACLELPRNVLARPGLTDRVLAATDGVEVTPPPAPSRDELLRLAG
jgi:2-polyprenyl-6-methoxyphenol hydroxylase-like FAD-dependent oxidoreductase